MFVMSGASSPEILNVKTSRPIIHFINDFTKQKKPTYIFGIWILHVWIKYKLILHAGNYNFNILYLSSIPKIGR